MIFNCLGQDFALAAKSVRKHRESKASSQPRRFLHGMMPVTMKVLNRFIDFKIVLCFKQKKLKNVTDVTEILPRFEYTIVTS